MRLKRCTTSAFQSILNPTQKVEILGSIFIAHVILGELTALLEFANENAYEGMHKENSYNLECYEIKSTGLIIGS